MSGLEERLAAARDDFAVGPLLERGVLRLSGKSRLDYLHRISTQSVNRLVSGDVVHVAFLNQKGHLIGEGSLLAREADLILDLDPAAVAATREHLTRYVLRDDVKIEDLSAELAMVPVLGRSALSRASSWEPSVRAAPCIANPRRGAPALDVFLPRAEAESFRAALLHAGAVALEAPDLEALRILGGFARFGAELGGGHLPMEAGIVRSAIDFKKGCYLGQEVVVRATSRGQLQNGLVQLGLPPGTMPGAALQAGGEAAGEVTSAADTPEGRIGLAYVRRNHWKEGARLTVNGGEAVVRRVIVEDGQGR